MDSPDPRPPHDQPHDQPHDRPAPARPDDPTQPTDLDETAPEPQLHADAVSAVSALLAAAGRPPQQRELTAAGAMPADVVDRITLALADAARLRVEPGPLTAAERGATVTPFVGRSAGRTPWMAVAAVAAAVAVIAVGGSALHLNKRSDAAAAVGDTATSAPSTTTPPPPRLGTVHIQASDTAYAAGSLADRARAMLTDPGPQLDPSAAASVGSVGTADGLSSCLRGLNVGDATSVSVDLATFDGSPAAIVVVTGEGETSAWVVARTCTAADPGVVKTATAVP